MVVEVLVDSDCHVVANAEDSTESIGTQTHVTILTHVLKALTLLLHRVVAWTKTIDFNLFTLNL